MQLPEAPWVRKEATRQHPQLTELLLAGQDCEEHTARAQVTALRIYFQTSLYVLESMFAPEKLYVIFFFPLASDFINLFFNSLCWKIEQRYFRGILCDLINFYKQRE